MERETLKQCRSCPWRVECVPEEDIPNGYSRELHESLRGTIAEPGSLFGTGRAMACHYSKPGEEFACAGWLYHQLGDGNNIALRVMCMKGKMPYPEVGGEQHLCFEDTLPEQDV
jgi:hypothetical protein